MIIGELFRVTTSKQGRNQKLKRTYAPPDFCLFTNDVCFESLEAPFIYTFAFLGMLKLVI